LRHRANAKLRQLAQLVEPTLECVEFWREPALPLKPTRLRFRRYLSNNGTDLSVYSLAALDQLALSLNVRPRKRHQFRTPLKVCNDHLRLTEVSAGASH
jgi:hypothetical protein